MKLNGYLLFVPFLALHSVEAVPARHRGSRLNTFFYEIQDGYYYHLNTVKGNSAYLKCVRYERGCLGRAVWSRGGHFRNTQVHQCRPDGFYVQEMLLRRRILRRCRSLEIVPFSAIIREERRRFPMHVQLRVSYNRMRTSMRNARLSNFPPLPATLLELTDILRNQNLLVATMTRDGRDNVYAGSVTAQDGSHCVMFASRRMLRFARHQPIFFADGTFKSVPAAPAASQIFTILTSHDHHLIPVAWVLIESRTMSAYVATFRFLRLRLGPGFALQQVITDYEAGQQGAWHYVIGEEGVELQGCLWHMARAFVKYAKRTLNLRPFMARGAVRAIIRLCIALMLLPFSLMTLCTVVSESFMRLAMNRGVATYRRVRPFLSYVARRWVYHHNRRRWMNCCQSENRTNNISESHNRQLSRLIGCHHPNIYVFLSALANMESDAYLTVRAVRDGIRIHRGRRIISVVTDDRLRKFLRDLGPIRLNIRRPPVPPNDVAIVRFLRRAVHLFDNVYDQALRDM